MDLGAFPGYRQVIAAQYDERYRGVTPEAARTRREALAPYLDRVLDALALPDEGWHLDVGCGDGLCALRVAAMRPAMQVVGVDASPVALALARGAAQAEGLRNATFAQADAEQPPEACYHRLSALSLLDLLPEKGAALRAWARVADRGARLVVTDGFAARGGVREGAGPLGEARFLALARGAGWRPVRQEDVTPLVARLPGWPWPEYVREGIRYLVIALER